MLFREPVKARIRAGKVTLAFRAWDTARVVAGNAYRLGPDDVVVVTSVERVPVGSLRPVDARRAGFATVEELRHALGPRVSARSKVFRVAFRHQRRADPRAALREDASEAALRDVEARLARMDARSRRGPWTLAVLELVAEHPRVAASRLARGVDRETRAFKADVRKLKELGLTESREVGYSLSPRGRALLRLLRRAGGC